MKVHRGLQSHRHLRVEPWVAKGARARARTPTGTHPRTKMRALVHTHTESEHTVEVKSVCKHVLFTDELILGT